jgi:hypothetical protein
LPEKRSPVLIWQANLFIDTPNAAVQSLFHNWWELDLSGVRRVAVFSVGQSLVILKAWDMIIWLPKVTHVGHI